MFYYSRMKTAIVKKSKLEDDILKKTVKCPYCAKLCKHGSDINGIYIRGCDFCFKEYFVEF
jgi:hypothetical protein